MSKLSLYVHHQQQQGGQAMTEFIVVMLVLLPCFVIFPLIYKYGDLAITTTEASRFAAFEAGMYGGEVGMGNFRLTRAADVTYDQDPTSSKMESDLEEYFYKDKKKWLDHKGKNLVKQVTLSGMEGRFSSFPKDKDGFYSPWFQLTDRHYRTSFVDVDLAELPWDPGFKMPKLSINRRTVIGFNGFDAPSPDSVFAHLVNGPQKIHLGMCPRTEVDFDCPHSLSQIYNGNDDPDQGEEILDIQALKPFVAIIEKNPPKIWNFGNPEIVPVDRLK